MRFQVVQNACKLDLPGLRKNDFIGKLLVAGDVGGTKTNLSLFRVQKDGLEELVTETYPSGDYPALVDLLRIFFKCFSEKPERLCLGVAGPVINGSVQFTNLGWDVHIFELSGALEVPEVMLLNDLEATAYGMAALGKEDFFTLQEGHHLDGNSAIVAPGTGLGEAGLYWDGAFLHPFPTEGGHCDFAPRTELDYKLLRYLQNLYGVVSWEKLVSGPAIEDIYHFLCIERNQHASEQLKFQIETSDGSAAISKAAISKTDAVCEETMQLFVSYLARECTSVALKMKALGGIYLGGGIPPKILPLLQDPVFMQSFMESDRMDALLQQVGIHVILNQRAPMLGAACYGAYGKW